MAVPKWMNFPKSSKGGREGGGGYFQSKSLYCRFWAFIQGFKAVFFWEKFAKGFSENERGGQRPLGIFPKIHRFWYRDPSLRQGGEGCWRKLIDREVIAFFFSNVISSAVLLSIIHEGKVKTLPNA